jgi:HlyD family secretion protein
VKSAQAAEQQLQARLQAASEAQELAKHRFQRAQELISSKAVPQAEYDESEHELHIAEETLRAAKFALQVAKYELEMAQSAFVRTQPANVETSSKQRLEIVSPNTGNVLRVIQESATVLTPGQLLLELGDRRAFAIHCGVTYEVFELPLIT